MADKITRTNTLYVGLTDSQNKIETLKLTNPNDDITEEQIKEAVGYLTDKIGIFDKYYTSFSSTAITTAYIDKVRKTELDLR